MYEIIPQHLNETLINEENKMFFRVSFKTQKFDKDLDTLRKLKNFYDKNKSIISSVYYHHDGEHTDNVEPYRGNDEIEKLIEKLSY